MGSVIATKAEIDGWINASPIRAAFQSLQPTVDHATIVKDLHLNVRELHRLREGATQLQEELRRSFALLDRTIAALSKGQSKSFSSEDPVLADV